MRRISLLLVLLALASCSRKSPAPGTTTGAPGSEAAPGSADGPQGQASSLIVSPAERMAALRSRLGSMTRREGAVTMGETQVPFSAWFAGDTLALIEVDDDLGSTGHMRTTYGFDSSQLFRVEAKGELRRNEPGRPDFVDPLEYTLDFSSSGGSGSGKWGPDELTDIPERAGMAVQNAEMLRRAAVGLHQK